jgi:hypothetical protein
MFYKKSELFCKLREILFITGLGNADLRCADLNNSDCGYYWHRISATGAKSKTD